MKEWYAAEYKGFEEEVAAFKAEELIEWDDKKLKCKELFKGLGERNRQTDADLK